MGARAVVLLAVVTSCSRERESSEGDRCDTLHACGIQDVDSPDFHGRLVRDLGWDFATCADCHGEDFSGGPAEVSCNGCHEGGPTACTTCHGDAPTSGAHTAHVRGGELERTFECATCHRAPARWDDAGHIFSVDGTVDDSPAEVRFAAIAGSRARYDATTTACSGISCHGADLNDDAATLTEPTWRAGQGQAACGTCHGEKPASHADDRCASCHAPVAAADGGFTQPALHVDGTLQVGRECSDCHGGGAAGAAPPKDLAGETSPELVTIGAHAAHVTGEHRLRGPIPCGDCHLEPADVSSPGHIDSAGPAEVFPGGSAFSGLASAAGSSPTWDRATATCGDAYCHGGGTRQADDLAAGLRRTPSWTAVGIGEATCGACHGVPPDDGVHAANLALTDCATCHPQTVDAFGNIRVGPLEAPISEHIDGNVDF
jgi:predicted CxxxxCH...CXXCH cytochrome family protein